MNWQRKLVLIFWYDEYDKKLIQTITRLSDLDLSENRRIVSKALKALNCTGEWRKEGDAALVRYTFRVDILVFVLSVIVHRW